jgi:F0F1-type ATP synthase membrane subunit c/vacuolar-type H+-ATPase subunit K
LHHRGAIVYRYAVSPTVPSADSKPGFGRSLVVLLAGAGAALAVGVTGLATTGTLGRAQRNHPHQFTLAITFATVAAACFVMAVVVASEGSLEGPWWKRVGCFWEWTAKPWRLFGVLAALGGVVLGYFAAVGTAGDAERPSVQFGVDGKALILSGTAKASHLSSTDPLNVSVDGLTLVNGHYKSTRVWEASVGPDSDGNVSLPVSVALPPGRFNAVSIQAKVSENAPDSCAAHVDGLLADNTPTGTTGSASSSSAESAPPTVQSKAAKANTGCQIFTLPSKHRPFVVAAFLGRKRRALKLTVRTVNSPEGEATDPLLLVEAVGRGAHGRRVALYRSVSEPELNGITSRTARISLQREIRAVCVRARFIHPSVSVRLPHCPLRGVGRAATVELRR